MDTKMIVKALFYATYGYVMYAYDVVAEKLSDYEPQSNTHNDWPIG